MSNIPGAIQSLGQAVSAQGTAAGDLLGAQGSLGTAESYDTAATIARQNAAIVAQSTEIQKTQEQRQIYQYLGAQKTGVAGAGMASKGTALDLLRSSTMQGELTKATTTQQGIISENSYKQQANQYIGMAAAARNAAASQQAGADNAELGRDIALVGSAVMLFSDRRLKINIVRIGTHRLGIGIYSFDYVWNEHSIGVMADEVEKVMPSAVLVHSSGFKMVNYGILNNA
jgi:hypothetical protein